jgi:hypothetical protein
MQTKIGYPHPRPPHQQGEELSRCYLHGVVDLVQSMGVKCLVPKYSDQFKDLMMTILSLECWS